MILGSTRDEATASREDKQSRWMCRGVSHKTRWRCRGEKRARASHSFFFCFRTIRTSSRSRTIASVSGRQICTPRTQAISHRTRRSAAASPTNGHETACAGTVRAAGCPCRRAQRCSGCRRQDAHQERAGREHVSTASRRSSHCTPPAPAPLRVLSNPAALSSRPSRFRSRALLAAGQRMTAGRVANPSPQTQKLEP
jgi:hypothetical protein